MNSKTQRRIKMIKIIEHSKDYGLHIYMWSDGVIYRKYNSHFDNGKLIGMGLDEFLEYLKLNESTYELFLIEDLFHPHDYKNFGNPLVYSMPSLKYNIKKVQKKMNNLELEGDYSNEKVKSLEQKILNLKKELNIEEQKGANA
jgi:hypothetical protein